MRRFVWIASLCLVALGWRVDAAPVMGATNAPAINRCGGDCDGNARADVDEVVSCTNIALGLRTLALLGTATTWRTVRRSTISSAKTSASRRGPR